MGAEYCSFTPVRGALVSQIHPLSCGGTPYHGDQEPSTISVVGAAGLLARSTHKKTEISAANKAAISR